MGWISEFVHSYIVLGCPRYAGIVHNSAKAEDPILRTDLGDKDRVIHSLLLKCLCNKCCCALLNKSQPYALTLEY
jgi:hypothetical protein